MEFDFTWLLLGLWGVSWELVAAVADDTPASGEPGSIAA